jgi:hypothetical protein
MSLPWIEFKQEVIFCTDSCSFSSKADSLQLLPQRLPKDTQSLLLQRLLSTIRHPWQPPTWK